jgi:hypothetical protein
VFNHRALYLGGIMTYSATKNNISKNIYNVLIRSANDNPLTSMNELTLRALANDIGYFGTPIILNNDSIGADVETKNALYYLDATAGNVVIDISEHAISNPLLGDVLLFQRTDVSANTCTVIDENLVEISLAVGESAIFIRTIKFQFLKKTVSSIQSETYTKIGVLEEAPAIYTEKGDSKATEYGTEIFTKLIKFECNDLQVNKANSDYYKALIALGNVDVLFYNEAEPEKSVKLLNFPLEDNLKITGNNWNILPLTGTKEVTNETVNNSIILLQFV